MRTIIFGSRNFNNVLGITIHFVIPIVILASYFNWNWPSTMPEIGVSMLVLGLSLTFFVLQIVIVPVGHAGVLLWTGSDVDEVGSGFWYTPIKGLLWSMIVYDKRLQDRPVEEVWVNSKEEGEFKRTRMGMKSDAQWQAAGRGIVLVNMDDIPAAVEGFVRGSLKNLMREHTWDSIEDVGKEFEYRILGYRLDNQGKPVKVNGEIQLDPNSDIRQLEKDWCIRVPKVQVYDVLFTNEFKEEMERVQAEQFQKNAESIQNSHFKRLRKNKYKEYVKAGYTPKEAMEKANLDVYIETGKTKHNHVSGVSSDGISAAAVLFGQGGTP